MRLLVRMLAVGGGGYMEGAVFSIRVLSGSGEREIASSDAEDSETSGEVRERRGDDCESRRCCC